MMSRPRKIAHHTSGDVATLFAMWADGSTKGEIAHRFGVSTSTIYDWAKRYALPTRKFEFIPTWTEPPAPSPEDEEASGASLALSPYVQARIQELQLGMPARSA